MLKINNLHATVEGKAILNGLNLEVADDAATRAALAEAAPVVFSRPLDELRGHALLIFEQCLENMDWRDALMAHADGNCLGAL